MEYVHTDEYDIKMMPNELGEDSAKRMSTINLIKKFKLLYNKNLEIANNYKKIKSRVNTFKDKSGRNQEFVNLLRVLRNEERKIEKNQREMLVIDEILERRGVGFNYAGPYRKQLEDETIKLLR